MSWSGVPWRPSAPGRIASELTPVPQAESPAAALRDGLARGEITVRYQPSIRLADNRPVMVEALARWQPGDKPIPPELFVDLAERTGQVRALSAAVAEGAQADLSPLWARLRLGVSINLPLALLVQPDVADWITAALCGRGLTAKQVAIELTETTPVLDPGTLRRGVLRLRQAGFRVLLDDVMLDDGRARLHRLPFSGLKLDRSLVEQAPDHAYARREIRRLVVDAEARAQTVIAEGVSDRRILSQLRWLGVHFAQGYAVGRPMTAAALIAWSAAWRASAG